MLPNFGAGRVPPVAQDEYLEGGKFKGYLDGKVKMGELAPSVAQLAIAAVVPPQLTA